jgi:hypothetical protein
LNAGAFRKENWFNTATVGETVATSSGLQKMYDEGQGA